MYDNHFSKLENISKFWKTLKFLDIIIFQATQEEIREFYSNFREFLFRNCKIKINFLNRLFNCQKCMYPSTSMHTRAKWRCQRATPRTFLPRNGKMMLFPKALFLATTSAKIPKKQFIYCICIQHYFQNLVKTFPTVFFVPKLEKLTQCLKFLVK